MCRPTTPRWVLYIVCHLSPVKIKYISSSLGLLLFSEKTFSKKNLNHRNRNTNRNRDFRLSYVSKTIFASISISGVKGVKSYRPFISYIRDKIYHELIDCMAFFSLGSLFLIISQIISASIPKYS